MRVRKSATQHIGKMHSSASLLPRRGNIRNTSKGKEGERERGRERKRKREKERERQKMRFENNEHSCRAQP